VAAAGPDGLGRPNPESARMVSSPLAPEQRTRAATSSTNLAVPRAVLARPALWRAREHLAAIGMGGEQRVVAKGVGVAVGSACLWSPCTWQTVESRSMVIGHHRARPSRPRA
jgi:hypothetical protein